MRRALGSPWHTLGSPWHTPGSPRRSGRWRCVPIAIILALAFAPPAYGTALHSMPATAPALRPRADAAVTISNFNFIPQTLTVLVGTQVTWTNQDAQSGTPHTVVADDNSWSSGMLFGSSVTYSHTFMQTGTFSYHCSIHPNMHGTVMVVAATPTPAPTSTNTSTPVPTSTNTPTASPSSTTLVLIPPTLSPTGAPTGTATSQTTQAAPATPTSTSVSSVTATATATNTTASATVAMATPAGPSATLSPTVTAGPGAKQSPTPTPTNESAATATPATSATAALSPTPATPLARRTTAASIRLNVHSSSPLQGITITGSNFRAGETVRILWDRAHTAPLLVTMARPNGSFVATVVVPQAPAGPHMILAAGRTSGTTAGARLTVQPIVFALPTGGRAGTAALLVGAGFGSGETVAGLLYPGLARLGTATSNANGTVVLSFKIPAHIPGQGAVIGYGKHTSLFADARFVVQTSSRRGITAGAGCRTCRPRHTTQRFVTITWRCTTALCRTVIVAGVTRESKHATVTLRITIAVPATVEAVALSRADRQHIALALRNSGGGRHVQEAHRH